MSSILYYITGHGFGHAVRSHQVIRALARARPKLRIYARTSAPAWLFRNSPTPVVYSCQSIDIGIVQPDSLRMELGETFEACRQLHNQAPEIIERESNFLRAHDIDVVVGDIPPLCFEIAARAGIPSVAVTNFTWDLIYRAYLESHPEFTPLVDSMTEFYRKATLALTLPHPCDTSMFPRQHPIPWITRRSSLSKVRARKKFGLPESAVVVLLSFGGLGLDRLPWAILQEQKDFLFVATGTSRNSAGNISVLSERQYHYQDLVRASDAIVTKPGYGIVADALAHKVPIIYTERGVFPEYPRLVDALRRYATSEFIPQEELLTGNLAPYLTRLLNKPPNWPAIDLDGTEIAAAKILELLPDRS